VINYLVEGAYTKDVGNRVYQKDEDVFYAVSDEDDNKGLDEVKSMSEIISKNHTESRKRVSKKINKNDEEIEFGKIRELTPFHIENKFYDPLYDEIRKCLPQKKKDLNINVWSIIKDAVGKDLSKFCVPGNIIK